MTNIIQTVHTFTSEEARQYGKSREYGKASDYRKTNFKDAGEYHSGIRTFYKEHLRPYLIFFGLSVLIPLAMLAIVAATTTVGVVLIAGLTGMM